MSSLPPELREALDATRLPWAIEPGSKHHKIKVNGRLAGIMPRRGANLDRRALMNTISQVRRAARGDMN